MQLLKGDITQIAVDAIVNAANAQVGGRRRRGRRNSHGGAVPEIMSELDEIRSKIGRCATGNAVVTRAGRLSAKFVFHAVGPVYRGGGNREAELLASCYSTALDLAAEREVKTISFPSISTGVYGYPLEEAAAIATENSKQAGFDTMPAPVHTVKLVQFSEGDHQIYCKHAKKLRGKSAAGTHG